MDNIKRTILLLSIIFFMNGHSIYAVEPPPEPEPDKGFNTEASITITEGMGPTYPVDPEKPEEIVEEEDPTTGSLAIVSISDFAFGAVKASMLAGSYAIATQQPNIQVVDLRGKATGWTLKATISGFKSNGQPSLRGATIRIINGRPNSLVSAMYAPKQLSVEITTDNVPEDVIQAEDGAGMGLWVMRWYPPVEEEEKTPYIMLEIPAGVATTGTHTAIIDWSLYNSP